MARRLGVVLGATVLTLLMAAAPVQAGSRTVKDEKGPPTQGKANSLARATLTYTKACTAFRLKVEHLRKKRTRAFGTVAYPGGSLLMVQTFHRKGKGRITHGWFIDDDSVAALPDGAVRSRWRYRRDVVVIAVDHRRFDPKPRNKRAWLDAYTDAMGAQGPGCPADRSGRAGPCNDDYVRARLRR